MKIHLPYQRMQPVWFASIAVLFLLAVTANRLQGASRTWVGEGADDLWSTPANWDIGAPVAGDGILFGGNLRLSPLNDYPAGTAFNNIIFNNPSGPFVLRGNGVNPGSGIVNAMPLAPQTINMPLMLSGNAGAFVVDNGVLTIAGSISGAGAGFQKDGLGQLILSGSNTFGGALTIAGGTVSVASDSNLGAVPAVAIPGRIVIGSSAALRTTSGFTLNANRGINVASGSIFVNAGATLTYSGIIEGSTFLKNGFGGLTLSGANSYGGDTIIQNGTVTLDFTPAASPMNNIIAGTSALILGGENAGLGTLSFAAVTMNGKAGSANSQSFSSTTVERGAAIIRATNGPGGTARLNLAALTHTPGGALNVVTPTATGGAGSIDTTTPNTQGILGAWAIVGDGSTPVGNVTIGNNWASVNDSGNIVAYTGYADFVSGNLHGAVSAATNLRINTASHPGGAAVAVRVNDENAGTLTDINTVAIQNLVGGDTLVIGTDNTLRLGRFGGIFRQDSVTGGATAVFYVGGTGGTQSGSGTAGSQNVGTLTAGGADNTPGEIVFTVNAPSQTQGSFIIEPRITDNGSGPVTVVKMGPGSMKIDGNNTYSGGLFILQGRVQFAGSEIGGRNPDGGGTGPIYILPGGQLFPSGATDATTPMITNPLFIAGLGGSAFSSGCIRLSGGNNPPVQELSGEIVLIGDTFISGGAIPGGVPGTNSSISGRIRGPFSFGVGQSGGGEGFDTCYLLRNTSNDWSGNTVISSRNSGSRAYLRLGNSEVIPDGLGKGNVIFAPQSGNGVTALDLNGYNETVNGISISTAVPQQAFVENREPGTTSVLTVGNNDASSSFAGIIQNGASGAGVVALTKTGRGKLTLAGANTYTGITTVNDGTLALSGSGSIASSGQILVNGGTLDVSEVGSGFTHGFPVDLTNGTLIIRSTATPGLASLSMAHSRIRVVSLGATPVVVETSALVTDGTTNAIDIGSVGAVVSYPAQFTIIKYASFGGVGFNFGLGDVPTPSTVGYVSNNIDNASIDLVLLDGPKPLTWTGINGTAWDINHTTNWLAFGVTPSVYLDVDSVRFDDSASTSTVNLITNLQPGAAVVNNSVLTYSYDGLGRITGPTALTKEGTGTLILRNTGTNDYFGPTTVSDGTLIFATENAIPSGLTIAAAGTVQVGTNGPTGNLPTGNIANDGNLVFRRTNDFTVANVISGTGTVTKNSDAVLTLSGANTFAGGVTVAQGTLRAGNNAALGTIAGSTTIESGATLDVGANTINLGAEPISASGAGVGNNGAIVNNSGSTAFVGPNITKVTMLGDTVFGGSGRLDFRSTPADTGTDATLEAANNFKLVKRGSNQLQLAGVQISGVGDIEVQAGILGLQGAISPSLGDPLSSLTVFGGATLHFFNVANPLTKALVLKDGASIQNSSGTNVYAGNAVLEGTTRFDVGGTSLTLNGELAGPGGIVKAGTATLHITWAFNAYLGPTTVSNGTLLVDGGHTDEPGPFTVYGGTLGGAGTIIAPTVVNAGGTLSPGSLGNSLGALHIFNTLTLGGTTLVEVARSGATLQNDRVEGVTTLTFGGTLRVNHSGEPLLEGDVFDLFDFASSSGTFVHLILPSLGPNLMWDTSQVTIDGTVAVVAAKQPGIANVSQSGTDLVISGTNGAALATYYVLTSTDVGLPLTNWARLLTNIFDSSGNFNFTNAIDPNTPQRFYLLQTP